MKQILKRRSPSSYSKKVFERNSSFLSHNLVKQKSINNNLLHHNKFSLLNGNKKMLSHLNVAKPVSKKNKMPVFSPQTFQKKNFSSTPRDNHYRVLIVGGGAAGTAIGAQLKNLAKENKEQGERILGNVAIVEPSDYHYYQPGWTLVGGGLMTKSETQKRTNDYIPKGVSRIPDRVVSFDPEYNTVHTEKSGNFSYDYMVVCPGIQLNWSNVKGLPELLKDPNSKVTSNYSFETADKTWELLQSLKSGKAVFTQPSTPVKCGGAPQKIMYLAEAHAKQKGLRNAIQYDFFTGMPTLFPAPKYAKKLNEICDERDLTRHFRHELIAVEKDTALFKNLENNTQISVPFDFLHATPPMGPPDFVKNSPLANEAGWVDIDKETLQHNKYPNIFSLGDSSSAPTSKTAAAVAGQSYAVSTNLWDELRGETEGGVKYDGYTSCPLTTGYGQVLLAEFDYTLQSKESFDELFEGMVDQSEPSRLMYILKKNIMPPLYWNGLLTGKWRGMEEYYQREFPLL